MKNTVFRLSTFVIVLMFPNLINAATEQHPYFFAHIDNKIGLSENCVKSIIQDYWGFMWFGTKNGLNRYDGNSIKRYDVDDNILNMGNHNISALYEDKEHRLWCGTDKGVFIFDSYSEKFTFFDKKCSNGQVIDNWISQIVGDNNGNIWIIAPTLGAFCYNPKVGTMKLYRTSDKSKKYYNNVECICVRKNGEVWLGTNGAGIFKYDNHTGKLHQFITDKNGNSLKDKNVYSLCDYGQYIAIGIHEEKLMKYNPNTNILQDINAPDAHYKILRSLLYDGKDLFVGTQDGLYIINEATGSCNQLRENDLMPYGISDNMIYSLYRDRDDGIWVGTMMSGVNHMPRHGMIFNNYVPLGTNTSLSSKRIREMQCDKYGDIWISTEDGKLNVFHQSTQSFENIKLEKYRGGTNRLALMIDGDAVWSGLFKNGLDIINSHTRTVTHYSPADLNLRGEGSVFALFKDHKGKIWLGTADGIYIKTDGIKFSKFGSFPDVFAQDITEDRQGRIWVTTIGSGVFCYDPKTGKTISFYHKEGDPTTISSNDVSSVTIGHNGNLWFSTDRGGICMFDVHKNRFTTFSRKDGLPDDVTYKILEDEKYNLWFGTNQGLVRFNPVSKDLTVYRNTNGLMGNQYNYKSAVRATDGKFMFGSTSGLISFNPLLAGKEPSRRKIYITNIRINDKEIKPAEGDILDKSILYTDHISLPYNISNVSLDVSSLNYSIIENDRYQYMLEGVDENWNVSVNGMNISYSQLQPGEYTFKVRLADAPDNIKSVKITVLPPWWLSSIAKWIYLMVVIGIGYYIYKMQQKRQARRLALQEQTFREETEKELLRAKINFFTDITHEIRTPLTLINGSVENLEDRKYQDTMLSKNLNAISKNSRRLLNLINQLLDFRKMDSNSLKLNFTNTDICKLIRDIIERFEPTVTRANKTMSLNIEMDSMTVPLDHEAFTKIMSNLLNNASKYSETFIQIDVTCKNDYVEVTVINDGQKIPSEKIDEIFKPFTRLDNSGKILGTGIGLPLARSLAELHNGLLYLDTMSEYNSFILQLPLHQEYVIELDNSQNIQPTVILNDIAFDDFDAPLSKNKNYTILLVEDNPEVMQMMSDNLKSQYNILSALDGKAGLDKVLKERIDLIVSDVMMPVMDGLEMCDKIKSNVEINHIPIILLTARHTLDNRIEGLRAGADAYIEKPFSFNHLQAQIESLLKNRERERENFLHKPYLPVSNTNINKIEEEFLQQISMKIIENIQKSEFNVEQLAQEMCMSRSSLHRKIKEVSNLTPIDFIRLIRLKKAAELMKEKGYRTTEVCEMVGISSPSYFIKLFQKQFGMTPKEFANQ